MTFIPPKYPPDKPGLNQQQQRKLIIQHNKAVEFASDVAERLNGAFVAVDRAQRVRFDVGTERMFLDFRINDLRHNIRNMSEENLRLKGRNQQLKIENYELKQKVRDMERTISDLTVEKHLDTKRAS